ncbi:hypothetical protein QFZ66_006468 [Streptomyces sp. B4I13]|uniref:hypothetical protein n=1 Tax=Streptomyces sp. B4I13 TaxID=3042271 RepID=UPI00277F1078|nr:hypothetical protein [Streptomyces sp. B4I13]MDQ0962590.1 hypothetical protein [Streptomyces sp. B4I13]
MGIRMLHRRKAHARVHATAAATGRLRPGNAPWSRPRPARAPRAATPRIPSTPDAALRTAAVRLRGTGPARIVPPSLSRLVRPSVGPFVRRLVPRGDAWRKWGEAAHGRMARVLGALSVLRVLGRLRGPRRQAARSPLFVAPPAPLTGPRDGFLPR